MPDAMSVSAASEPKVQVLVHDLAGHQLCNLEVSPYSTGRDVKQEIAHLNPSIGIRSQRLVGDAGIFHDFQFLTHYSSSTSPVLLTVLRLQDEITNWLESIDASPFRVRGLFRTASDEIRSSWECALAAVARDGLSLQFADSPIKANREIALAAVKENGLALMYVATDLAKDPEVVIAAVSVDGMALEFACEELQNDRPIVATAMRQNVAAFQFAGPSARQDFRLNYLRVWFTCRLSISRCPADCRKNCVALSKKPRAAHFCALCTFLCFIPLILWLNNLVQQLLQNE